MEPMDSRSFALQVVQHLQAAGYQALWAGGCVRDQMLGLQPKDYDVATIATPDQVRAVFGRRRTLAIGAAFGVITVLGAKGTDPIEVATFRRDGGYSDGRRPDTVEFTNAREDALRRDFTINGMFFDPIKERIMDFVGGQRDLAAKMIRAIGDPHQRIEEDKLRMLRGVRFAARYGFSLEPETLAAIRRRAPDLQVVSKERIGAEMQRMLADAGRATAVQLLGDSGLMGEVIPGACVDQIRGTQWKTLLNQLDRLCSPDFCAAAVMLLESVSPATKVDLIADYWRLSNVQKKTIDFVFASKQLLSNADRQSWSKIQPLLLSPYLPSALAVLTATGDTATLRSVEFIRQKLAQATSVLNPAPLITGKDLIANGIQPGPDFKSLLDTCRAKQLDGLLTTKAAALEFVRQR